MATTCATLAQEAEQATRDQQPQEDLPINQELTQEGQAETMTQAGTTLVSQMLGEVIYRN